MEKNVNVELKNNAEFAEFKLTELEARLEMAALPMADFWYCCKCFNGGCASEQ